MAEAGPVLIEARTRFTPDSGILGRSSRNRPLQRERDPRLPPPGTIMTREYKGRTISIHVLSDGFEYQDQHFRSLSALAKHITRGSHCNGFAWFGLAPKQR